MGLGDVPDCVCCKYPAVERGIHILGLSHGQLKSWWDWWKSKTPRTHDQELARVGNEDLWMCKFCVWKARIWLEVPGLQPDEDRDWWLMENNDICFPYFFAGWMQPCSVRLVDCKAAKRLQTGQKRKLCRDIPKNPRRLPRSNQSGEVPKKVAPILRETLAEESHDYPKVHLQGPSSFSDVSKRDRHNSCDKIWVSTTVESDIASLEFGRSTSLIKLEEEMQEERDPLLAPVETWTEAPLPVDCAGDCKVEVLTVEPLMVTLSEDAKEESEDQPCNVRLVDCKAAKRLQTGQKIKIHKDFPKDSSSHLRSNQFEVSKKGAKIHRKTLAGESGHHKLHQESPSSRSDSSKTDRHNKINKMWTSTTKNKSFSPEFRRSKSPITLVEEMQDETDPLLAPVEILTEEPMPVDSVGDGEVEVITEEPEMVNLSDDEKEKSHPAQDQHQTASLAHTAKTQKQENANIVSEVQPEVPHVKKPNIPSTAICSQSYWEIVNAPTENVSYATKVYQTEHFAQQKAAAQMRRNPAPERPKAFVQVVNSIKLNPPLKAIEPNPAPLIIYPPSADIPIFVTPASSPLIQNSTPIFVTPASSPLIQNSTLQKPKDDFKEVVFTLLSISQVKKKHKNCPICNLPIECRTSVVKHFFNAHRKFICNFCDMFFSKRMDALSHILKRHLDKKNLVVCMKCSSYFDCSENLLAHIQTVHRTDYYRVFRK